MTQMALHKCDHTRGVDTKQLDDGIGPYLRITGEGETLCPSFALSTGEPIQRTLDSKPAGWLILLWGLTRGATAEALGEELL